MGVLKGYKIELTNALTGAAVAYTIQSSSLTGKLSLIFPDTLTSDTACPILFFKLYRTDDTFLAPIVPDTVKIADYQFEINDKRLENIEKTNWDENSNNSNNIEVTIQPNPTNSIVNIAIFNSEVTNGIYTLFNENGDIILSQQFFTPNFIIDLSVYPVGAYYLTIKIGQNQSTHKIIKI